MILALGANDALRGIDPSTVRDNLDKIIAKIEASGAKVLLLGMVAPQLFGQGFEPLRDRRLEVLFEIHQGRNHHHDAVAVAEVFDEAALVEDVEQFPRLLVQRVEE